MVYKIDIPSYYKLHAPDPGVDRLPKSLKEIVMPLATVRVMEGVLDEVEKSRLMERITEALVEIEGQGNPNFAQYCWVFVEEVPRATWGVGGKWLTPEDVKGLVAAR
jgi:4-oxalocrotonate tautomerase